MYEGTFGGENLKLNSRFNDACRGQEAEVRRFDNMRFSTKLFREKNKLSPLLLPESLLGEFRSI